MEEVNNLNNLNVKNKSITFPNNYESNELNKSKKGIYNNSFNKNKILCDSEKSNEEKFENRKKSLKKRVLIVIQIGQLVIMMIMHKQ